MELSCILMTCHGLSWDFMMVLRDLTHQIWEFNGNSAAEWGLNGDSPIEIWIFLATNNGDTLRQVSSNMGNPWKSSTETGDVPAASMFDYLTGYIST